MATGKTGTIIIGANYSLRLRATWVENYDTATNTSNISITKLEALTDSNMTGKWFLGGNIIVNGQTVGTMSYMGMGTHQVNVQYAQTWFEVTVQSGSGGKAFPWVSSAIAHNADGTKSISISWEDIALYRASDGNNYFISDGSESVTLTTIPRASSFSLSGNGTTSAGNVYVNINDSNKLTVNISRAATTFTHDVEFYIGSTKIAKHTGIATQTSMALEAATWLPHITDRKETDGLAAANAPSVKVTTKDASGNSIGTSSKRFDIRIPNTYAPSVSITALTPVSSLKAPFDSLYLQGLSMVKATVSCSAQHGATYSYKMSVDGGSYGSAESYTSNYLTGYGTKTVTVTATDSRGYTASAPKDITVIAYQAPKIQASVCARCKADGTLDDSGTYLRIKATRDFHKVESGGVQNNFCAIQYQYKIASGDYSGWETILDRTATTDEVDTGAILGSLAVDTNYIVQVRAVDDVGNSSVPATFNVPSESVYMHKRATSLGVGTYNYNDRSVAVGWKVDMGDWINFGNATRGLSWETADGSVFSMRPYAAGNLFQVTYKNDSKGIGEYGVIDIVTDGNIDIRRNVWMSNNRIIGVGDPIESGDAVPKSYADRAFEQKVYWAGGQFVNSDGGTLLGSGTATVVIDPNGLARIDFSVKIHTAGTYGDLYRWGINRDILRQLNGEIPNINPIKGGTLIYYNSDGTINTGLIGFGGLLEANNQFWTPSRVHEAWGPTGQWGEAWLPVDNRLVGTCYGTVT